MIANPVVSDESIQEHLDWMINNGRLTLPTFPDVTPEEIREAFCLYVHEVGDHVDGAFEHFFGSPHSDYVRWQTTRLLNLL